MAAWVRPLAEAMAGALLLIWFFKAASWRTGCLLTALPSLTKRAPFVLGVLAGVPLCPPLAAESFFTTLRRVVLL